MTYAIHYPQTVLADLKQKNITPVIIASNATAATVLAAYYGKGYLTLDPDPRFVERVSGPNGSTKENFHTMSITVHDSKDQVLNDGTVTALQIEQAINEWAIHSEVAQNRGERIAIVSNVDRVTETGVTILVWDIIISTFVVYSYRRATSNFGAEQSELDADMQNLVNKIQSVNDQLTVTIY